MSSTASERAVMLAQRGDAIGAARLLEQAVAGGDAGAAVTLAGWRLAGDPIRRDLRLARELYGRAADLGLAAAEPVFIALLANGAGGSGRHWGKALKRLARLGRRDPLALRESQLLSAMKLDAEGNPRTLPEPAVVCENPSIRTIPGFLTRDECRFLSALAQPRLQPAVVVDPRSGQMIRDPVRTARGAAFPFIAESPLLHAVNRRIAVATGTAYEQGEPLQILAYAPGEEYKLHSDALPGQPNQRVMTLLVTLDTGFTGGETTFPRLGIEWRGKLGEALVFANVDDDGRPEPLAWHAGLPVSTGRKMLLSKWLRGHPLDLAGPPGRPL